MTRITPGRHSEWSGIEASSALDLAVEERIGKLRRVKVKPLGDCAWWVELPGEAPLREVLRCVRLLEKSRPPGVRDVVSSFASFAVHFDGGDGVDGKAVKGWMEAVLGAEPEADETLDEGRYFEIPVCYDGEDLPEVAQRCGLPVEQVIALHSAAIYTVAAVGFSPGFPYLLGLPAALRVPRRETPRLAVAGGAVAIAGAQAGIYPSTSPGGWHVLGRTDEVLFCADFTPPAMLRPGDRVKFVAVPKLAARLTEVRSSALVPPPGAAGIEVIQAGAMDTVQDLGRPGHEAAGVSPGGAADPESLRLANHLVGNLPGAAGLEICLTGPVLKFHQTTQVARVDGIGKCWEVPCGGVLDFSKPTNGLRGYLGVAGGIRVPEVLGSAATDLRGGFGGHLGRCLRSGDFLFIGVAGIRPKPGPWHIGRPGRVGRLELRFLVGAHHDEFTDEARVRLRTAEYQITPQSDRMGARLKGPELVRHCDFELLSQPVACGTIQVPPDGQPIILLAARQTLGGYPQIGHVISADLPKLAQAWPGTAVRFRQVSWEEAQLAKRTASMEWARLAAGIDLKR